MGEHLPTTRPLRNLNCFGPEVGAASHSEQQGRNTMAALRDDSTPQQTIRETYSEWLEATGRVRCNFCGVLFARQVTNQGQERCEGLTEDEVCKVIDCSPNATD